MAIESSRISDVHVEVEIAATTDKVWESLTKKIGKWWPAEFFAGGEEGLRDFSLEAFPGGRMMESWSNGGGVLWGNVVGIEPGANLQVLGATFPSWGGPTQWFGTWQLVPSGESTVLKFSEHSVGRISDTGGEDKEKGWIFLSETLKAHAEGNPPPSWVD